MPAFIENPDAPSSEALDRLCAQIAPAARPCNVRRLGGGAVTAMHAVDLVEPSGERHPYVIRRYHHDWQGPYLEMPERGWRSLGLVEAAGLPAPRPVLFDPAGAIFGVPSVVMTHLDGRAILSPGNIAQRCCQMGEALAAIHAVPVERLDVEFLSEPNTTVDDLFKRVTSPPPRVLEHPDGAAVVEALRRSRPHLSPRSPVFCHGDYWSGNVLWQHEALEAVVDWDWTRIDPPGIDVGYARMDLSLLHGAPAPDLFLQAYEHAAQRRLPDLFFWDLLAGLQMIELNMAKWLERYEDIEPTHLDIGELDHRLRSFIRQALDRANAYRRNLR